MELTLEDDQPVSRPSESFSLWREHDDPREKKRYLEILERQIEEKNLLLRAKEEEMGELERKIRARIKKLIVAIDEKETRLAEMEEKTRRLERQSRRHALMEY